MKYSCVGGIITDGKIVGRRAAMSSINFKTSFEKIEFQLRVANVNGACKTPLGWIKGKTTYPLVESNGTTMTKHSSLHDSKIDFIQNLDAIVW